MNYIIITINCICTYQLYTAHLQCHTWNNHVSRVGNVTTLKCFKCMLLVMLLLTVNVLCFKLLLFEVRK